MPGGELGGPAQDRPSAPVCFFQALHDMGDPGAAIRNARDALADGGSVLLVEPKSHHDAVEDNLTPFGRLLYGFSTMFCVPNALAQHGPEPAAPRPAPPACGICSWTRVSARWTSGSRCPPAWCWRPGRDGQRQRVQ